MSRFTFELVVWASRTSVVHSHTYKGVLRHTYKFNPDASCRLLKNGNEVFAGKVGYLKVCLFQDLRDGFPPLRDNSDWEIIDANGNKL